jgi:antitoxin HigA-1
MVIDKNGREIFPATPTHPGEMLADELEARQMTQKAVAELTGVSPAMISAVIHQKKGVSLSLALRLEAALGISAEFWINAQRHYERTLAYHAAKRELIRLNVSDSRQQELLRAVAA